ncbi:NADH-quinone oxidoreductase subunit F [Alkalispirochaeta americana]|uniref:NADH-quinone oxidoreductase subunit F n=1 Tax=Alkalispirochaeta americana TaxID=159291 RepID=A0A1N6WB81_9SPIO|nr:NADH-ubiquinone oxidoreductase-F iron-sulfur binding region domain-containing protein [Alkalispirochaeta americana]SIQ87298.1 NADH-quinone oxidoreductase subunit F [Alkalispirochaeta americana]
MSDNQRSVSVCGGGGCVASGSLKLIELLQEEISREGIDCLVTLSGCMGPCARGPIIKIQPDGVLYQDVCAEDVPEIVSSHLKEGNILERLCHRRPDTGTPVPREADIDFFRHQKKIVLAQCGTVDPLSLESYQKSGGYQALQQALGELSPDRIIGILQEAGLRGRGGAGFPTWKKWRFTRDVPGEQRFVVCNADEGDPGAFMDRSILEGNPHGLIEGMAIAAYVVGASKGYIYVRAEYPVAVERLSRAINSAREAGILGDSMMESGISFDLEIRMGSGAFVCGEETALMASIEGQRGEPRPRPPFPAESGLWQAPTLLNNVETYANVPPIITNGAAWFANTGTEKSPGTKVFALAGAVVNTGLVEVPMGTTLGEIIYDIGGGITGGKSFKAAQIGGPSGGCIPREHLSVPLDYESVSKLGAIMGSGGLIVMDDDACMVDVARFFLEFVQEESCGKCVPCRVGTKRMLEILNRICEGHGMEGDIERLEFLGNQIKETSLCGLGQSAPNPVLSTIRYFREEYEQHIHQRHCEAGVCPSLVRAPCQSACPAGVDVPGFVSLVGEERYAEALRLHRERNPFAAVCARVCFHTCEEKCRRAALDSPVAIRSIKRFMVDQEVTLQHPRVIENKENEERKIAIIGGGPAGLSCGYFLARLGYRPVVFEAEQRPGGMLVQTIPAYRLPRETLAREIRMIEQLGVTIETQKALGRDFTLDGLRQEGYEALFLALGAPEGMSLGIPGEDAPGVVEANAFLREYNIRGSVPVGKNVVVVGGGNAAVDAARTALRLGAETVTIVYRRSQEQMPAYAEEISEALHEGVRLRCLAQPVSLSTGKDGTLEALRCSPMALGAFDRSGRRRPTSSGNEPFTLKTDQVIVAIGQKLNARPLLGDLEVELTDQGFLKADPSTGQTSVPWLFAGGDAASGPASVVWAIAAGERAARGMDMLFTGEDHAFWREEHSPDTAFDPDADPVEFPREAVATIPVERRRGSFDEVELPWNELVALRQCQRCLRCDYGKVTVQQETHYA